MTQNNTNVYEVKKGRKWSKVQATSMLGLDKWCAENGYSEWRMVGMQSIAELAENKNLPVVA